MLVFIKSEVTIPQGVSRESLNKKNTLMIFSDYCGDQTDNNYNNESNNYWQVVPK